VTVDNSLVMMTSSDGTNDRVQSLTAKFGFGHIIESYATYDGGASPWYNYPIQLIKIDVFNPPMIMFSTKDSDLILARSWDTGTIEESPINDLSDPNLAIFHKYGIFYESAYSRKFYVDDKLIATHYNYSISGDLYLSFHQESSSGNQPGEEILVPRITAWVGFYGSSGRGDRRPDQGH